MAKQLFTNNAVSLLAQPISATDTSLVVMSGYGALFPNPGANEYFLISLEDQSATTREIIRVTGRVGDTFTFDLADRGMEGTTPRAWSASQGNDTLVDHRLTAGTLALAMELPTYVPSAQAGQEIVDDTFSIESLPASTELTLSNTYIANTTKVYVGGLRLKRGVDFIESGPAKITLLFSLSQANIDDGTSVVVDYVVA